MPLQNIKTNITHSLQSTLIFATSYQPQRTHTTTTPILSLTRKHTLHALSPHKNNVLISLWHFRAIEQVLVVGEMAPAVPGPQGTLLLTPDNEEEFLTCNVGHNATFVLELQGGVPLHAKAEVLAMATGESPVRHCIPWDLHGLIPHAILIA